MDIIIEMGALMSRNSNDDRSDSMNPNNGAYHSSMDNHSNQFNSNNHAYDDRMNNHSNQMNPNNAAYQSSSDDQEYYEENRRGYYPSGTSPRSDYYSPEMVNMRKKQQEELYLEHLRIKFAAKDITNFLDEYPKPGNRYGFLKTIQNEQDICSKVVTECQNLTDDELKNMQIYLHSLKCMESMIWTFKGDPNQWLNEYTESYKDILTDS